jgi:hypothetical protein
VSARRLDDHRAAKKAVAVTDEVDGTRRVPNSERIALTEFYKIFLLWTAPKLACAVMAFPATQTTLPDALAAYAAAAAGALCSMQQKRNLRENLCSENPA